MQLSRDDVRKVAALAKLELSDSQLDDVAEKLRNVLRLVDQLSQVDTTGVEEMAHPVDVHSVTRGDQIQAGLPREAALRNAPQTDGEFFLVPPVLG
ncbi:MAG: Asp-tRNA(Asn)/Glu-tRNA(Gln) amidotransferase subunit GatC [Pirellulaceae bacterium]|nr:Asp-tRNA(Asn)/Glu-tRNA(Gln) amidotransferase subunit GatC [Pirellulaceae bacterium]